jgi:hypothetical protein
LPAKEVHKFFSLYSLNKPEGSNIQGTYDMCKFRISEKEHNKLEVNIFGVGL